MGFLDSFFAPGASKIKGAKKAADTALGEGYAKAGADYTTGYGEAQSKLQPYMERGNQYSELLADLNGINGPEKQKAAQDVYFGNPALQQSRQLDLKRTQQGMNTQGNYSGTYGDRSGPGALADSRVNLQNYRNFLGDITGQAGQGAEFAKGGAELDYRFGGDKAALDYGYGNTKAGNEINYGNALAQSQQSGINNLIKVGAIAAAPVTGGLSLAAMGGGNSLGTQSGTQANGGWTTTTTKAPQSSWWNWS